MKFTVVCVEAVGDYVTPYTLLVEAPCVQEAELEAAGMLRKCRRDSLHFIAVFEGHLKDLKR